MDLIGKVTQREQLPVVCRPPINEALRKAILAKDRSGLVDLWENSPVRFDDNHCHTEAIIDVLFPQPGTLLCVGRNNYRFETTPRKKLRGRLHKMQFIVPSPMTGLRDNGKRQVAYYLNPATIKS
jgi:hypothetical protein